MPEQEYMELLNLCEKLQITTVGELHDLYVRVDSTLLCDIFEHYRHLGMTQYRLDPSYFISSPSFSWEAMLLNTGVELELLTDLEMYK